MLAPQLAAESELKKRKRCQSQQEVAEEDGVEAVDQSVTTAAADAKTLLRYDEIIVGWKRSLTAVARKRTRPLFPNGTSEATPTLRASCWNSGPHRHGDRPRSAL